MLACGTISEMKAHDSPPAPLRRLLERVLEWAARHPDVVAVAVTGSVARGGADELSDLDVELFLDPMPDRRDQEPDLDALGDLVLVVDEATPEGCPARLMLLEWEGRVRKVDLSLLPLAVLDQPLSARRTDLYRRGYLVLLDRCDVTARIADRLTAEPEEVSSLDQTGLEHLVHDVLFDSLYVARFLARDERWAARALLANVRALLLRLLEADAWSRGEDPRHLGLGIERWADAEPRQRLDATFAGAGVEDALDATTSILAINRIVGRRLAQREALRYPETADAAVTAELDRIIATIRLRQPEPGSS